MIDKVLEHLKNQNWREITEEIVAFIKNTIQQANASGAVIGLSGGVDSSVTATLLVRALGPERVYGLIMPTGFTPKADVEDAEWLAGFLGIEFSKIHIDPIVDSYIKATGIGNSDRYKIPLANLRARVRMTLLYLHSNSRNLLVAGTGDKSEILLGYFTKYGDGAVDFLPIAHLYKTQVRELGRFLGLPERIYMKPSSPQLYPGHRAVDELPEDYDILDPILYYLFDLKKDPETTARELNVSPSLVTEVVNRYEKSRHKRAMPPSLLKAEL